MTTSPDVPRGYMLVPSTFAPDIPTTVPDFTDPYWAELVTCSKAGRLRSGYDTRGSVRHAATRKAADWDGAALCGARPHIAWNSSDDLATIENLACRKCRKLLAKHGVPTA